MKFNEDTRVKIPVILHLMRLGYQYLSLKDQLWDQDTNIFPALFVAAISKINPGIELDDTHRLLEDTKLLLDNEDLGRAFFERLSDRSNTKLIDFENFNNNSFHVVTELTCQNCSGTVKTVKIILPKSKITEGYTNRVHPILLKQDLIEKENEHLTQLRDWLLPMLMNGQVTVT